MIFILEQKELIEKAPTINITAYDYFLQGRDYHKRYWEDKNNHDALEKAIVFYQTALEIDSTFAQAWTGLAWGYWDQHYWDTYFEEDFLDSVRVLTDIALSFDKQVEEAYYLKGAYFVQKGDITRAEESYKACLDINPNSGRALRSIASLYIGSLFDYVKGIESLHKAVDIDQSSRPDLLVSLAGNYSTMGFFDKANNYYQEALESGADTARVYTGLAWSEFRHGNMEKARSYVKMRFEMDSTNLRSIYNYGHMLFKFGYVQEAYEQISKIPDLKNKVVTYRGPYDLHNIGYILWNAGKEKEAEYYFNEQVRYCTESIRLNRGYGDWGAHYDLAAIYAFRGDKEKAFSHLEEYEKKQLNYNLWFIKLTETKPHFNSIREDPRFIEYQKNRFAKYQAEHERIRQWLEENDML